MKVVLRLTRSQQMAVLSALMDYHHYHSHSEVFIDCSTDPPTETSLGELLRIFGDTSEMES